MKLVPSTRSIADLDVISEYLVERSPQAARRVEMAIRATLELLIDFPFAGRMDDDLGVQVINVSRFPYLIYYRVEGDEVKIIHIRDGRRRSVETTDL